jgi:hypothetical protein
VQLKRVALRIWKGSDQIGAVRCEHSIVKVGRLRSAHVQLDDDSVSRMHCIIETSPLSVFDLGSRTGTRVNGELISKRMLRAGDRIDIGVFTLVVEDAVDEQLDNDPISVLRNPAKRALAIDMLLQMSKEERAFANQLGDLILVGIDKLREHRGLDDDLGTAYAAVLECLGVICIPRAAPSIILELAYGMPVLAGDWRMMFAASIAHHDAMWPYLVPISKLPGFARACAIAARAAGRDLALDEAPREDAGSKLALSQDAYEAVLDQERCEALAALTAIEALAVTSKSDA